jgi:hypothetical protein
MATYHLYFLKRGLLVESEDIEAASDNEAARIAEGKDRGDLVEIWNAHSRVRIVRTGGAQLETAWNGGASEASAGAT